MEVSLDISGKGLVDLLGGHAASVGGVRLSELVDQSLVVVALEKAWDFSGGQKSIHSLEEGRRENVGLVEDEGDLFLFAACSEHDLSEVLIKGLNGVVMTCFYSEYFDSIQPGDEPRKSGLSHPRASDQQHVSNGLL